ncbi:CGNR zinc finger domain-containing protein [Nitrospiraceae bacterium AH_259_D15_M11_P09]|nr:CGNR zinc finger domain-containing protein [Nitrospiraceae bacterium AH_259_D15_M11_P09]
MTRNRAHDLQRLNILLRLAKVDVESLDENRWNALLDELYLAVFGVGGRSVKLNKAIMAGFDQDAFHTAMTREGVRAAQEGLRATLPILQRMKGQDPAPSFQLKPQRLFLAHGENGFAVAFLCLDGPTMIYTTLAHVLERSGVRQSEIRTCANERCGASHVPLRTPHAGRPSFCSQRCGNLLAARAYRMKRARQLRKKERERSRRRYEEKVHAVLPGTKIARHRRKTR